MTFPYATSWGDAPALRGYGRVGGKLSLIVVGQGTALTLAIIGIWATLTKAQLGHSLAAANLHTLHTGTRSLWVQSVAALPSWSHLHCHLQVTSAITASSLPPPLALQGGPGMLEGQRPTRLSLSLADLAVL